MEPEFREYGAQGCTKRNTILLVLAILIIIYVMWLIVAGIFIFPLCAHCPIEALWALLWVLALLSTLYLGYFVYKEFGPAQSMRAYTRPKRLAVRVGYGVAILLALAWFVLLVAYAAVYTGVGTSGNGKVKIAGIKGDISIGLSKNEIVTVNAEDEFDLLYGLGWAHATHRLFQMEVQRRIGQGRLSELVGKGGLDVDKFSLTTGFYAAALRDLEAGYDPAMVQRMQAYVDGVNAFIRGNFKHSVGFKLLGYKPKPVFTVADVLTYAKLVSYSLSGNWKDEIARLNDHLLRDVSGARLSQLSPMDPQSTVTVISDAAIGSRYDHIPPSTHRNYSLEYEVDRLDAYLQTAQHFSSNDDHTDSQRFQRAHSIRKDSDQFTHIDQFGKSTTTDSDEDLHYIGDLLAMAGKSVEDELGNEDIMKREDGKPLSVYERAQRRFPTFFQPTRGFTKASNNWVLHGSRTRSGKPLLCNDPHLGLTIPSIWMMASLNTSKYSVIGASFPGLPGIPIGRNKHIAWGVTNSGMDVQDLFVMDEVNATAYIHNGEEKAYRWRMEKIPVKGGKTVDWPVKESLYGPVVNPIYEEDDSKLSHSVSLRWTSLEVGDTTIVAFYHLFSARNWTEFRQALSYYVAPAQNFIYADMEGNIGYQLPGPIPIRVEGHTGTYPVPGNGSFDWIRKSDFWDESLWVFNPPEGYIISANNMIATAKYPLNILNDRDWEPKYRASRITELLTSAEKYSIEDMKEVQMDTTSLFAREMIGEFYRLEGLNDKSAEWQKSLKHWDANEMAKSKEAYVFESLMSELALLPIPETDAPYENPRYWLSMIANRTYPDPICSNEGYHCGATVGKAFNAALKKRVIGKTTSKNWGSQHETVLFHQIFGNTSIACLFNRKHTSGGSPWTVNVAVYDVYSFKTIVGPSYRQIIDLSDVKNSLYILPGGVSEVNISPHYSNLFKQWVNGDYLPLTADDPDVIYSFKLIPKT